MALPLAVGNGISTGITPYFTSGLSAIPADASMAFYANAAGSTCVIPIFLRLKDRVSGKVLLLLSYSMAAFLYGVIGMTDNPLMAVMASFVLGLVKFVGLLELITIMIPIMMPDGNRYKLYTAYYPLALISAQITPLVAALGSGSSEWRFGQLPFAALLLFGMLITLVVARDEKSGRKIPLYRVDWPGLILVVIFLLLFDCALSYGQTKGWYASKDILTAAVVAFAAHSLAVSRATTVKRPFLLFPALSYKNVIIGLLILFLLCLLLLNDSTMCRYHCWCLVFAS